MKLSLVVVLVLSFCSPAYALVTKSEDHKPKLATLEVHLEVTRNVLTELKDTLNTTNTTLQNVSLTLTTVQNSLDVQADKIRRLEEAVQRQDDIVATLIDGKKKIDSILTFLIYAFTFVVSLLGVCGRSHVGLILRSIVAGHKK